MEATTGAEQASSLLLEHKEALARAVTERLYGELPHLADKYGESGRAKCLQDMRYNVEHLAPAVGLEDPALFAEYVRWLDGLLRARAVATDELVRCLELTREEVRSRFPADLADAVAPSLAAGLAALGGGGGA